MEFMVTLTTIYTFIKACILGPISIIIGINKVISQVQAAFKFIMSFFRRTPAKNEEPNPPRDGETTADDTPTRTYVKTVGKTSEDFTPYVSATGIRADSGRDAVDALKGIKILETIGQERGSTGYVEATGIDLRSRQRRPEEGRGLTGDEPQGKTVNVTGITGGHAQTVTAVGFRF